MTKGRDRPSDATYSVGSQESLGSWGSPCMAAPFILHLRRFSVPARKEGTGVSQPYRTFHATMCSDSDRQLPSGFLGSVHDSGAATCLLTRRIDVGKLR